MEGLVQTMNTLFKEEGLGLDGLWTEAMSEADRIHNQPAPEEPQLSQPAAFAILCERYQTILLRASSTSERLSVCTHWLAQPGPKYAVLSISTIVPSARFRPVPAQYQPLSYQNHNDL